jgi:hypothetical protein
MRSVKWCKHSWDLSNDVKIFNYLLIAVVSNVALLMDWTVWCGPERRSECSEEEKNLSPPLPGISQRFSFFSSPSRRVIFTSQQIEFGWCVARYQIMLIYVKAKTGKRIEYSLNINGEKAIENAISWTETTELRHLEKMFNKGKCDWGKSNKENCTRSSGRECRSNFYWSLEILRFSMRDVYCRESGVSSSGHCRIRMKTCDSTNRHSYSHSAQQATRRRDF